MGCQTGTRRGPRSPACAHGVTVEVMGVLRVRLPGGDVSHALGQQVPLGMVKRGMVALRVESGCKALRQANLTIATMSQADTKV